MGSGCTLSANMMRKARFCERSSKSGNKMTVASIGWLENSSFIGGGAVAVSVGRKTENMEVTVDVSEGGASSYKSR